MIYETENESGTSIYKFEYSEKDTWITISVNGKVWGASDGNRFIKALLRDIQKLQEEVISLKDGVK